MIVNDSVVHLNARMGNFSFSRLPFSQENDPDSLAGTTVQERANKTVAVQSKL